MSDFGFNVYDNEGRMLSSDDVFFSMAESTITVRAGSTLTIRPSSNTHRVAYAVSPINGMYHTFSMQLNSDNSLTVRNTTGYSVAINILRF